jgi:elongation factor Ts
MAVTIADINKLRKSTGAGMMDCKKALVEADGDFDNAVDVLRKKGAAKAAKRADRDAGEGLAFAKIAEDGKSGVLLVVNCETDFVAKNADFNTMVSTIVDVALNSGVTTKDELNAASFDGNGNTVAERLLEATGTIGEKIEVGAFYSISAGTVVGYNHPGNQIATIVGLSEAGDYNDLGKEIAMHIAASQPVALDESGVSEDVKTRELNLAREKAVADGKPEQILDKIAQGALNKFYKEQTLVNQILTDKKTVGQIVKEKHSDLKVSAFNFISLS